MKLIEHLRNRTPYERTFHAVMYELIGIITSMPIVAIVSGKSMTDSGIIAVLVSFIAMVWNYIFNLIFDKALKYFKIQKSLLVRVVHGILFEVGLVMITVPTIALTMGMTLLGAFMLEFAMLLYFLPYTMVFNWGYDKLKDHLIKKLARAESN